jgi:histidinol dehydrogenase
MRRVVLAELSDSDRRTMLRRSPVPDPGVMSGAADIVASIRDGGDEALQQANTRFGGGPTDHRRRYDRDDLLRAASGLEPHVRGALQNAAANITAVHTRQMPVDDVVVPRPGVEVARRWSPHRRVGAYVPGGLAPYPSSVLMTVLPARIAGVAEVAIASPAGDDGLPNPVLLGAAGLAGADELFVMGGAQAIGALAYGTETIAPVDMIVGPGNAWVTAAKLAVFGVCGIDLPAGPSESLELVDDGADPTIVAADLICQAEHGPDSQAVLVSTSTSMADAIESEVTRLLATLDRSDIIRKSLNDHGWVVVAADIDDAIDFANAYGPEHLAIHTADSRQISERVTNAGSVFIGHWSPHSAGDYATGGNHVLPTGGLARSYGPLGIEHYGSWRQVQTLTEEGLRSLQPTVADIAEVEGLTAHRLAVDIRFEESAR